jgi:hypothetical protein
MLKNTVGRRKAAMDTITRGDTVKITFEGEVVDLDSRNPGSPGREWLGVRAFDEAWIVPSKGAVRVLPPEPGTGKVVLINGKAWVRLGTHGWYRPSTCPDSVVSWSETAKKWKDIYRPGYKVLN